MYYRCTTLPAESRGAGGVTPSWRLGSRCGVARSHRNEGAAMEPGAAGPEHKPGRQTARYRCNYVSMITPTVDGGANERCEE
eukprot:4004366-Prymnesium_polylepis.1